MSTLCRRRRRIRGSVWGGAGGVLQWRTGSSLGVAKQSEDLRHVGHHIQGQYRFVVELTSMSIPACPD